MYIMKICSLNMNFLYDYIFLLIFNFLYEFLNLILYKLYVCLELSFGYYFRENYVFMLKIEIMV